MVGLPKLSYAILTTLLILYCIKYYEAWKYTLLMRWQVITSTMQFKDILDYDLCISFKTCTKVNIYLKNTLYH